MSNEAGDVLLASCVVAVLAVLSWYDLRRRIIPNRIVLPAWVGVLGAQSALHPDDWQQWLIASGATAGAFLVAALFYPAGLGMGDVKLVGLIGAALGYAVLTGLFVGTMLAAVFAAGLLLREGTAARKATLPYGPFLAAGAVAALVI
jgi:leader peptidase (prepilin peptidase) / N-methyltransferase